jgi:DsbC/DsbD-like thiol-disulfide interchange protein
MRKSTVLACIVLASALPATAHSASSDWQELGGGKARLVVNKDPDTGRLDGMVEVRLNKGWKTYWKSPGGSGIAPEFDFSTSTDAYIDTMDFPVPEWISVPDASFYGYRKQASFVFSGMAETPDAVLNLDLLIGVCEEICIPATARFAIGAQQLNQSDPKSAVSLAVARSLLPGAPSQNLRLTGGSLDGDRLHVEGAAGDGEGPIKAVVSSDNGWVSDPFEIQPEGGTINAKIPVPDFVMKQITSNTRWGYTLLRHAENSGRVTEAVAGRNLLIKTAD